jgi:hypothetical protein
VIVGKQGAAAIDPSLESTELTASDSRKHIAKAIVVSKLHVLVVRCRLPSLGREFVRVLDD